MLPAAAPPGASPTPTASDEAAHRSVAGAVESTDDGPLDVGAVLGAVDGDGPDVDGATVGVVVAVGGGDALVHDVRAAVATAVPRRRTRCRTPDLRSITSPGCARLLDVRSTPTADPLHVLDTRRAPCHASAMTSDAIVVEHLRVTRGGREVLPDLSLRVPAGQVVGLLGPSGGGKSTLMRAVVGVQVVESGTVTVLGERAGSPGLRRRVGYLTQAPSVYGDLTVRDNVRYFARVVGADDSAVDEAIRSVDLTGHVRSRVDSLSGGQRSRASLACVLVGDPDVLVLDEPTVGLDPVLRRDLWDLFRGLADRGRTVLVSSHVMDEATRCDRLLLLRAGEILSDSTLPELLSRTGAADAEQAFLALVDPAEAAR